MDLTLLMPNIPDEVMSQLSCGSGGGGSSHDRSSQLNAKNAQPPVQHGGDHHVRRT